jgi:hypothetical protein
MHALFGTIAIMLFAASSFANAPVIRTIPDIIISDKEDNIGFTIDNNLFRYINAINLTGYISDPDSPTTSINIAFVEASTHHDTSINDKMQLDMVTEFPNSPGTWGAKRIRMAPSGSFIMSFRDTYRSPGMGNGPFPDPLIDPDNPGAGAYVDPTIAVLAGRQANGSWNLNGGRAVVLYFADDHDNVTSRILLCYSINMGMDGLSGAYSTVFSDTFQTLGNWTYTTISGMSAATSSFVLGSATQNGLLSLSAGATATGLLSKFFARWETTALPGPAVLTMRIPYVTGSKIYVARFRLSVQGPATQGNAPTIRLGTFMPGNNIQIVNWIGSVNNTDPNANPQLPALNTPRIYPVYWSSHDWTPNFNQLYIPASNIDARTWALFFDVHDVNQQVGLPDDFGMWSLSSVEVLCIDRPPTTTLEHNLTNLTSTGSWGLASESPNSAGNVQITQNSPAAGQITFTDPGGGTVAPAQFLMWGYARAANVGLYTWDTKLRRATIFMACPTTTNRNNFHRVRFRHLTFGENVFQEFYVRQQFSAQGNPVAPIAQDGNAALATHYEAYVAPYGQATALLTSVGWHRIAPVIDQLYNIPGQTQASATSTVVQKVTYEAFDEPTF